MPTGARLKGDTLKLEVYSNLLIVPYGIETVDAVYYVVKRRLLIVPYGIETSSGVVLILIRFAFNRTLWN